MYTIEPLGPSTRLRPGDTTTIGRDQPEVMTRAQPDTIDLLEALHQAWRSICAAYDVNAELPETPCLFEGVDLRLPKPAAESIVANMLLSAMEEVGRFSPAYKKPIGLIHVRDRAANRSSWLLSPETRERWQNVLRPLALAHRKKPGLAACRRCAGRINEERTMRRVARDGVLPVRAAARDLDQSRRAGQCEHRVRDMPAAVSSHRCAGRRLTRFHLKLP